MHHNLALLINITVALATALVGGYLARKVGLPSLVGYLLAGLVIGPFTPGFVGDTGDISQLAEMGVIFMMFGVGLHFSLKDLWAVRRIAIPGALLQMVIATGLGFGITQLWGWSMSAGFVLGLAISIASTVVLLRGLMDNGLLETSHGQVAVGWLVLEDLATIAILVLLPALFAQTEASPWAAGGLAIAKTLIFVGIMLFVGKKFLPWLLMRILHTRSRELFILAVVALALGTALSAAEFFGVSLALGAFLAGVVVGESEMSHQVGAETLPFRELFTVLFFVSVGMLVNPAELAANAMQVLALTALIVVGKGLFTLLFGLILPASGRTMLVVAVGLSQIGEFSFIVGQEGLALGILSQEQYGLILASALLSIIINPLLFRLLPHLERFLQRSPGLWKQLNRSEPPPTSEHHGLQNHVIIVGYGRVGRHIVHLLEQLKIPCLVVEKEPERAKELHARGIPVLFGDSANSEIMTHVRLEHARALVVTLPDEADTELVVTTAHDLAPTLPIIARATTESGISRLNSHGAEDVIHPELEGGLEIVRYTLLRLNYPPGQVQHYIDAVRNDAYEITLNSTAELRTLDQLLMAARGMEVIWSRVPEASPLIGQTIVDAKLRERSGASIIALVRDHHLLPNPKSSISFVANDLIGLIGDAAQIVEAEQLINPAEHGVASSVPAPANL